MELVGVKKQKDFILHKVNARIQTVLTHGNFIQGPEVSEVEARLKQYVGVKHCISCANGTDALQLALMALDIGKNDVVFTSAFSFFASAEAIALVGATPHFVDIEAATYNLCPDSLEAAIIDNLKAGVHPAKAVIAVDLYGLPADYRKIKAICHKYGLKLIEDAAQSFSGSLDAAKTCSLADIGCTSFFPAKPLGCYGDGGACFTDDDALASKLLSLRVHGKGQHKYDNIAIGMNSRLDTIQAAVLLEKIPLLDDERHRREQNADEIINCTHEQYDFQKKQPGAENALAQLTLRARKHARDGVLNNLKAHNIPFAIYYGRPLNIQPAMRFFPSQKTPVTTQMSAEVFSVPCHAYLTSEERKKIIAALGVK